MKRSRVDLDVPAAILGSDGSFKTREVFAYLRGQGLSGATTKRPTLERCLKTLSAGDFLLVSPDTDLSEAFAKTNGASALVMEGDNLLGLLTPENLSEFLMLRQISQMQSREHPA